MTQEDQVRYSAHLNLPGFGREAQKNLSDSTVLMVGAGGLGSPAALYLAAAGIGKLIIIDDDRVDLSNLQRQVLHGESHLGESKVSSAQHRLNDLNSRVQVVTSDERFTEENAREWVSKADIVFDGADNFPTRYLLCDAAYFEKKPLVHGSIFQHEGQVTVFHPSKSGGCYRCLFPKPPTEGSISCAEAGVLGVLPGTIGTIQATEVIKLITGIGEPLIGTMLIYDAMAMTFNRFKIQKKKECELCGASPSIKEVKELRWACQTQGEEVIGAVNIGSLGELNRDFLMLDVRNDDEVAMGAIEGSFHIPLPVLQEKLHLIDAWKDRPLLCYCQSGVRSLKAIELLRESGFTRLVQLEGGYRSFLKNR